MNPRDITLVLLVLGAPVLLFYSYAVRRYRLMPTARRAPHRSASEKRSSK